MEQKIEALLARMTLDEKIGQITLAGEYKKEYDELIREGKIGVVHNLGSAQETNTIQRIAVEETRLGVPLLFGHNVVHGFKTIFPIPLAEACSWDLALMEHATRIGAKEAVAAGIRWTYAPVVDITRDPRWGRIAEGAGEDPYLGSAIAVARIRGFQENPHGQEQSLIACLKHFAAYGAAEAGKDYNTADISERTLREIYLPPFKAAVEAKVGTIMCSYNEINGVPATANRFLLTKILREEWGFEGLMISDAGSITELVAHGIAATPAEAAAKAINAGIDMDMSAWAFLNYLKSLVQEGRVNEKRIDEGVRRVLRIKFRLGLFDHPYVNPEREQAILLCQEHLDTARETARKSIVLLKNNNGLLPLDKQIKSIAVIGPLADDREAPLGAWACVGVPENVVTVLEGIKAAVLSQTKVYHAKGCDVSGASQDGFVEAIRLAKQSEVAILVVGETRKMSGEGHCRTNLDLPGQQEELVKAIYKTGTPVIVVILSGRPLTIVWLAEHIPAIVEAWLLGSQSGHAIADVLFGDCNPAGKLPITFPRVVGQIPIYYNHKNTGRPARDDMEYSSKYLDVPVTPLFPFGYGLSYTKFAYANLKVNPGRVGQSANVTITAEVKNIGNRAGDEIVQLYVQDVIGSMTRPVKELKGFKRITLAPGETQTVEFSLSVNQLGFYNEDMQYLVEPGTFKVWAGPNSVEGLEGNFEVVG